MNYKIVAFYGAGMLGSGFVKSLRRQGYDVHVWNRSFEKAKALEAVGARAFANAADAARDADIVHICVRDEAAVDATLAAALPGIATSAPIVDHTTVAVASVVPRAQRLHDAGYAFLHAPVFMGPPQAEAAQGVMLASGPQSTFDALQEHLATMTGKVKYLGERIDLAAIYKLMEGQITGRGKRMAEGEYSPLWTIDMAEKDARLMQAAANGVPLPVIDAVDAAMRARIERKLGDRDLGALAAR